MSLRPKRLVEGHAAGPLATVQATAAARKKAATARALVIVEEISDQIAPMLYEEGDYFGRTVNLAARIANQAGPGQVLVGGTVADNVNDDRFQFLEVGTFPLKGIAGRGADPASGHDVVDHAGRHPDRLGLLEYPTLGYVDLVDMSTRSNVNEPLKIDVWSDIACPWCYIGKRNLEAGIAAFVQAPDSPPVEVEYHSFELSPDTPVEFSGSSVDFLVSHKRMPAPEVEQMLEMVTRRAAEVGLSYDFDKVQHTNTIRAHQLIHYAKARGLQHEAKERLMAAYFVEGRHVGRIADLADLAAEIGLDRDDVVRSLTNEEYLDDVNADKRQAAEYGISGVPFFVIAGRYGVSGAQPPEAFSQVLAKVASELDSAVTG